jgi:hypothetical protein
LETPSVQSRIASATPPPFDPFASLCQAYVLQVDNFGVELVNHSAYGDILTKPQLSDMTGAFLYAKKVSPSSRQFAIKLLDSIGDALDKLDQK